jgi:peptidoglycan/LPS O-acetylase OafA/YrhL
VLIAHLTGTSHAPDLTWTRALGDIGRLGVRTFFVISGFLMTVVLDGEERTTGRISLIGFLRRRTFRIAPAFGVYLGAIAAMSALGMLTLEPRDLLMASTFTMNFHATRSWLVGHLWSLSVEAQFYVCWAVMRVIVGRIRMLQIAVLAIAFGPIARVAIHIYMSEWRWSIGEALPTVIDSLAMGSLLAMVQGALASNPRYVRWLRSRAFAVAPAALIGLSAAMPHIAFSYSIGETVMNLVIALIVHRVVLFPGVGVGRLLNAPSCVALGMLSYSLYLWQQPFLNRHSLSVTAAFPLNITLAIGAAILSYRVVERPALMLARRIEGTRTATTIGRRSSGWITHAAIN